MGILSENISQNTLENFGEKIYTLS